MRKINLKETGITLIALVVTIIVLLILAAVTINIAISNNGLISRANDSKVMQKIADIKDSSELIRGDYEIANEGKNPTSHYIIEELIQQGKVTNSQVNDYGDETGIGILVIEGKRVEIQGSINQEITFKITQFGFESDPDAPYSIDASFKAEKDMTWREWVTSDYYTRFIEEWNDLTASYNTCHLSASDYGCGTGLAEFWSSGFRREQVADIVKGGLFINNTASPDDKIIENGEYQLFSWWAAECVAPDSSILTQIDGNTTLAKDVKENDSIVYYDFDDNNLKEGTVEKVYIHKNATNLIKYTFEDGSYLEVTDYHPIYTKEGWKSSTNRNGYEKPQIGDEVKTENGYKKLVDIEAFTGKEDYYDFKIISEDGKNIDNYFANGILVQNSIK